MTSTLHPDHSALPLHARIRAGESQAFTEVHKTHKARLLYYAKKFLAEWSDAEDAVAEAFVQLWLRRSTIESDEHLTNFLYRAVRTKAIDRLRQVGRKQSFLDDLPAVANTTENQLEAELLQARMVHLLAQAIKELPPQCQRVFELSYRDERSPQEIARILNMDPATVRSQKRRAIALLRAWIESKAISVLIVLGAATFFTMLQKIFHFLLHAALA